MSVKLREGNGPIFQGVPAFSLKNKRFGGTVWFEVLVGFPSKKKTAEIDGSKTHLRRRVCREQCHRILHENP